MRPLELQVEGFTAYREPTTINFEDADYFALVGPTGSGKSSVIDALCFALYGSVPRYDDQRVVAPAISQGQLEAKVSLRFALDGDEYTAVRVTRRVGARGATTKEALLQRGEEVLASGPDELTAAVVGLVGLNFDQFTRCVVLPQGEFAAFLHDKPAARQALLTQLLGLGIYDRMKQTANQRAAEAEGLAKAYERDLATRLGAIDDADKKRAAARVSELENLRSQVKLALPQITRLDKLIEESRAKAEAAEACVDRLAGVEAPDGVGAITEAVSRAQTGLVAAKKGVAASVVQMKKCEEARKKLGDPAPLRTALEAFANLDRVEAEMETASKALTSAKAAADKAKAGVDGARRQIKTAQAAFADLRSAHLAHAVAGQLVKGESCPVCEQVVTLLPRRTRLDSLTSAEVSVQQAEQNMEKATAAATAAGRKLAQLEERINGWKQELSRLKKLVAGVGSADAVSAKLAKVEQAADALEMARDMSDEQRSFVDEAQAALDEAKEALDSARLHFTEAREDLIDLGPPKPQGDLGQHWGALLVWAERTQRAKIKEQNTAVAKEQQAVKDRCVALDELLVACDAQGVSVGSPEALGEELSEASTAAKAELAKIAQLLKEAKDAKRRLKAAQRDQQVARDLGYHLANNQGRFPSWLLREALQLLAAGASEILYDLSQGRYALGIDDQDNFSVVDHHNADDARSAKTLSGGETFLAALALALALSDHVVSLAAEGAQLDALFLDEGFGTLDSETLDTVASTIETLGSSGRMVGLVTHVRELAERIPVRFEVRRDGRTARVKKVYA